MLGKMILAYFQVILDTQLPGLAPRNWYR
jgi:hypothetical protein